jgi:glucose/arabinose dehydrogenase
MSSGGGAMLRVVALAALMGAVTVGAPSRAAAQLCVATVTLSPVAIAPTTVVDIRSAGDARLFLVEQDGRIQILDGGGLRATPFLDLSASVISGGERGLLSLAFHPSYPSPPWFFVYYTNGDPAVAGIGDIVLARYSLSADANVADPASARVLLTIPHGDASNHNGGQLQFGPRDGFLYVSVGDGGGACASALPGCNPQRPDQLLGKLLRVDVNLDSPPYYRIPPGNPFAAPGLPRDEIWATGMRNPFRMSFDRQTGDLWIADVGEVSREEIDFQPASSTGGENYGWPIMEGDLCGTCSLTSCPTPTPPCNDPQNPNDPAVLTLPFYDYGRDVGSTIIGGYLYRGQLFPGLRGCYMFGDNASGHVWSLPATFPIVRRSLNDSVAGLTTFGEDRTGELYLATDTRVYRLLPAPTIPAVGSGALIGLGALLLLAVLGVRPLARRLRRARA